MASQSTQPGSSGSVDHTRLPSDFIATHTTFAFTSALQLFIAVLNNLSRDIRANIVLLAASLWGGRCARDRHGCA